MRSYARGIAVVAVGVLHACGKPSPPEESKDALLSWSSSVDVAASAWLAGDVPSRYLRDLLTAAADALRQERARLASAPAVYDVDSLQHVEQELAADVERMRRALEANDRGRVRDERDLVRMLAAPTRRDTSSSR